MQLKKILKKLINLKKQRKIQKKRIFNDTDNKIEGDYNKVILEKKIKKQKNIIIFIIPKIIQLQNSIIKMNPKKNILLLL